MSAIEIFTQLREIFPFETLINIKKAASFYQNDSASLEAFVQSCLGTGHFPDLPNQTDLELENFLSVQFQTLKEFLPDADPAFIEALFETQVGTPGMQRAIMEAVTHQSYTKKTVRKREDDLFDVKLYCELVPDPLGSFSHRNYIMTDKMTTEAVEYLVKIFGEPKRAEIISVVTEKQGLYLSYKKLREMSNEKDAQFFANVKTAQQKAFIKSPDYGQILEKLFIENEGIILSFLTEQETQEKKKMPRECFICFGLSTKMIKICSNGHEMCGQCVKSHTELLYYDGIFFFPCTYENCSMLLSNAVILSVWDTSLYSKLLEDRMFISKQGNGVTCPFCNYKNCSSNDSTEICCTHCTKKFCVTCKKISHLPLECNKRENDLCKLVEERMTQALIRKCPSCNLSFIKERQCCNKMWCSRCNIYMCYVCRKILPDGSYKHFYGQGVMPSEAPGCCPLYSDINTLHTNNIVESGKALLKKIKDENPDVQLLYNPMAVLPKLEKSDAVPNQF